MEGATVSGGTCTCFCLPGGRRLGLRSHDRASLHLLARLYRPTHPLARAAVGLAGASGVTAPLSWSCRPGGSEEERFCARVVQAASEMLGASLRSFAVTFDSGMTRATVALTDSRDQTLFLKVGSGVSGPVVKAEAATIDWFRSLAHPTIVVPVVLGLADCGGLSLLALSDIGTGGRRRPEPSLNSLLPFLSAMRNLGHTCCDISEALRVATSLASDCGGVPAGVSETLTDSVARRWKGQAVEMCLAHGDFVSWNLEVGEDGLHLWDWEHARRAAPWPYDAIHFVFQRESLVRGRSVGVAVHKVRQALFENSGGLGIEGDEETIQLLIELYAVFRAVQDANAGRLESKGQELLDHAVSGL